MTEFIPLTNIQRLIGKRMLASKRAKPCFYLHLKADVTKMMKSRSKLRKRFFFKVTSNSFILYAASKAAEQYPFVLGKLQGENIQIPDAVNMGFAVNAPQGLVVPVIKKANEIDVIELAKKEKELTEKARSNKLELADLDDMNISVSNLGPYNINSFYGIIPPTDSVILTVGNISREPVFEGENQKGNAKMVSLNLAADHRVVNGVYAAKFLNRIKTLLEDPESLLPED